MLKQFKEFAFKGNLVDMAVGFILGAGFAAVVKSLVSNVIMPALSPILGNVDFTKLKYVMVEGVKEGDKVVTEEVAVKYGTFITEAIGFIVLAFVVFILVKKVIDGMKKEKEEEPEETPRQEVLLEEILAALKK